MKTFNLEQRGISKGVHGWNNTKDCHIEVCFHHPKQEVMIDIENNKNRIFCETFVDLLTAVNTTNRFLKASGIKDELWLTEDQIKLINSNFEVSKNV